MAERRHPISHHWIKQTLEPFLLYAFASTLPYPADISEQIQRSVDFCLEYPFHASDGEDLVFERIFMAVMHRHKKLAPDLEVIVDNLESLAKFLIRRAQLKGPYELLGRSDIGSGAWVDSEQHRLKNLVDEPVDAKEELLPPRRPTPVPVKPLPADKDLDPRLMHAKPGQFTTVHFPEQLSLHEDAYYRRHNLDLASHRSRTQRHSVSSSARPQSLDQSNRLSYGLGTAHATFGTPYQQRPQDYIQGRQAAPAWLRPSGLQQNVPAQISNMVGIAAIHQTPSSAQNLSLQPQLGPLPAVQDRQSRQRMPPPDMPSQRLPTGLFMLDHQRALFPASAAQQRAREIVTKVSAYEQNLTAQQREHERFPGAGERPLSRSIYSQPAQMYDLTSQPQSARSSEQVASEARAATEAPSLGATMPIERFAADTIRKMDSAQHSARTRLPSLEQTRGRYYPSQQQASIVAPTVPTPEAFSWAQDVEQHTVTQGQPGTNYLGQQTRPGAIMTSNPRTDVPQQLQDAAGLDPSATARPSLGEDFGWFGMGYGQGQQ